VLTFLEPERLPRPMSTRGDEERELMIRFHLNSVGDLRRRGHVVRRPAPREWPWLSGSASGTASPHTDRLLACLQAAARHGELPSGRSDQGRPLETVPVLGLAVVVGTGLDLPAGLYRYAPTRSALEAVPGSGMGQDPPLVAESAGGVTVKCVVLADLDLVFTLGGLPAYAESLVRAGRICQTLEDGLADKSARTTVSTGDLDVSAVERFLGRATEPSAVLTWTSIFLGTARDGA
jgi:hypothetical protein